MTRRAVTNGLLIDGGDGPAVPGSTVVWEHDRITWVGPDGHGDLEGASVVDAGGGAVLPGLIDSHVHLCLDATLEGVDRVAEEPTARLAIRSAQSAKRLFDAGVTTARDQGSRDGVAIEVASAQRSGWLIAARILAAGRGITPTGGHGWMIGVEADGPDAVREAVGTEIERGADVIKLFPTGGVLGAGAHGFAVTMSLAEVRVAVEVAHAAGKLVGAHVHGPEGIDLVLEAGVDTVEHGTAVTSEQAERMAASGVALVPTLAALAVMSDRQDELSPELADRVREVWDVAKESVRRAIDTGVTVLAGTDAGTPFNPHGMLVNEIALLAELGLGNAGALRAATARAADVLRLDDLGRIEPGKRADLVVLGGDPLHDLGTLESPRAVVQDGKIRVLA